MATDFKKKLKAANKFWKSAKEKAKERAGRSPAEFEDGRYMARCVEGIIGESESSGRLQVRFDFKFEEGEYEGQSKYDYQGLETEQNLEFLAARLEQLGYEPPESLEDLQDILDDIKKTKALCRIRLKSKGDFQNVYIDKVFSEGDEEEKSDEEEEDAEEQPDEETEEEGEEEGGDEEETEGEDEDAEESDEEAEEDEEEADEEDDTVELNVGMTVTAATSTGPRKGEVIEILEADGKARVRMADDNKVLRIPLDKIEVDETVPEEPKAKKKAAPAPAPAPAPVKKKTAPAPAPAPAPAKVVKKGKK